MPPIAVVDTSVLVSAFLFPESVPGRIITLAGQGRFAMHLSPILLEEVRRSLLNVRLRNTYGHYEERVMAWCTGLRRIGSVFSGRLPEIGPVCRDPDDDHVIATAVAVGAGIIVTGDEDLLSLGQIPPIRILTARVFLSELAPDLI